MKNKNNYITRTFTTLEATALCINPETQEITTEKVTLPKKTYKTDRNLELAVQKRVEGKKVVKVNSLEEKEELRAMPIDEFLKNSVVWVDEPKNDNE